MVAVPGLARACIDRYEARIDHGRAVPATDAPADSELTWFDAESACRRAGFRLCEVEEFERACAGADRSRTYPYGPTHVEHRCNIAERFEPLDSHAVAASGAFPECVTPEGVFDLSGNAIEWLATEGRGGGLRALRGGSAFQPSGSARCVQAEAGFLVPDEAAGGFRCCTTLDEPR
jgi:formylglycine-generating enzyme required for sulfatase activity